MADIFLSYARHDLERARSVAEALTSEGWDVFWDLQIVPGQEWDAVIERHLSASACVVVLWSRVSIQNRWVRSEAHFAHTRHRLIPAMLDDVEPPVEFRLTQYARLHHWNGDRTDPEFKKLCDAILTYCQAKQSDVALPEPAGGSVPSRPAGRIRGSLIVGAGSAMRRWARWPILAAAAAVVAVLLALPNQPPDPVGPDTVLPVEDSWWSLPHAGFVDSRCQKFEDPPAEVSKGPVTRIDVWVGGYIHGIRIYYGSDGAGEFHGFDGDRDKQGRVVKTWGITPGSWQVPEGERITRVDGAFADGYVSWLRFVTDKGTLKEFGSARSGGQRFEEPAPSKGALIAIRGSAETTRGGGKRHRAICSMEFQFVGTAAR